MVMSDDPEEEDDADKLEEALRNFIQEELRGVYFFGLSRCPAAEIQDGWPRLYSYLTKNYGDFLKGCVFAKQQQDKLSSPIPYIMLPDESMSVLTWDEKNKCPTFSESEDLAQAIKRLK